MLRPASRAEAGPTSPTNIQELPLVALYHVVLLPSDRAWLINKYKKIHTYIYIHTYIHTYIHIYILIKGEYLVKNTTDIRIDVIFYD